MTQITNDMKTDWFPYTVKPKRVGEYEIRWHLDALIVEMRFWNGHQWLMFTGGTDGYWLSSAFAEIEPFQPDRAWRGLKAPYEPT